MRFLVDMNLGRVDVALPVDRDVVKGGELSGLTAGSAESRQRLL